MRERVAVRGWWFYFGWARCAQSATSAHGSFVVMSLMRMAVCVRCHVCLFVWRFWLVAVRVVVWFCVVFAPVPSRWNAVPISVAISRRRRPVHSVQWNVHRWTVGVRIQHMYVVMFGFVLARKHVFQTAFSCSQTVSHIHTYAHSMQCFREFPVHRGTPGGTSCDLCQIQ